MKKSEIVEALNRIMSDYEGTLEEESSEILNRIEEILEQVDEGDTLNISDDMDGDDWPYSDDD